MLIIACFGLIACNRTQPVYTVDDNRIPKPAESLTQEQIKDIIIGAAHDKRWRIDEVGPGELRATLNWQNHSAISSILYSKKGYSIKLDSSKNLKEQNGVIHRKYNQEVQALEAEIDKRLYRKVH